MAHRIVENAVNRRAERLPEDRAVAAPSAADTPGGAGEKGVIPPSAGMSAADSRVIAGPVATVPRTTGGAAATTAGPGAAAIRAIVADATGRAGIIPVTVGGAGTEIRAVVTATARAATRTDAVGLALARPVPSTGGADTPAIVARSRVDIPAIAVGTRGIATADAGIRAIAVVIRAIRMIARGVVDTARIVTVVADSVAVVRTTAPIVAGTGIRPGAVMASVGTSAVVATPAPVSAISPVAAPTRAVVVDSPSAGTSPVAPGRRSGAAAVRAMAAPRVAPVRPGTVVPPNPCPVAVRAVPSLGAIPRAGSAAAAP